MNLNIAVIIPHFNDTARLRRCLGALVQNDLSDIDILVVDNGSTESLDPVKDEFPTVRFVSEPRKGAASARNRGVNETKADILAFLDADCIPAPGWLAAVKATSGRSDIIGGAIDVFDETPPPRTGAQAFETVFAFNYRYYIEKKRFSVTANLVAERRVFEAVGPFIDGVSEDEEWCWRAGQRGFRIIVDEDMRVLHPTRSDWNALKRKWHRLTREMFELHRARKGPSARFTWALRALAMPASAVVHLPRLFLSPKLATAGDRFRGGATLIRLRLLRAVWMLRQACGLAI
ncbi:glycosyltransferase [Defluviimonas aestuarii]|uniref:glycosyltransferase family 2 protein n=1 Tax=Albidovulum aestuarii TaxID=1130726 RepID=UPI00249AB01B|nr:glycosyltransferase [Defluviimonas aestuarii]MDI3338674.1 glycosyltransferase [Defluviimonas aestuarii]